MNIRRLIRVSRPINLILAALTYSLGTGISHYLGHAVNPIIFGLGLLAILSVQSTSTWLVEYFHLPSIPLSPGETPRDRENYRVTLLQASYAALTLFGAIAISLLVTGHLNVPSGFIICIILIFLISYSLPPMHLADLGFGELILAVYISTLMPVLAFLLQSDSFHRLLTFATFPLTLLTLAYFLINDFPTYASDLRIGRHSLLTRLTWQRAIPIHHVLILAAFLFFAAAPYFGIPWRLVWPVFAVLPFAAVQIIWLQRISLGGRTLWNFLINLALVTFGLTAYLLAFTFWLH
jgi:1,4-dihydroxy-2-naphthoate octaprenyltransferase